VILGPDDDEGEAFGMAEGVGLRSLIPPAVRLTAAIDGVVDVVNELTYLRDDTTPEYQRFWRRPC
jgi:hypothetical protein